MTHNPEQEEEEKQKSNGIHNHLSYRVWNTWCSWLMPNEALQLFFQAKAAGACPPNFFFC